MLQRRQPSTGTGGGARARHGHSRVAGRTARTPDAARGHRGPGAGDPLRDPCARSRVVDPVAGQLLCDADRRATACQRHTGSDGCRVHAAAGRDRGRAAGTVARHRRRAGERCACLELARWEHGRWTPLSSSTLARRRSSRGIDSVSCSRRALPAVLFRNRDRRLRLRSRTPRRRAVRPVLFMGTRPNAPRNMPTR